MHKEERVKKKGIRKAARVAAFLMIILSLTVGAVLLLNRMSIRDRDYALKSPLFWKDPSEYDVWLMGSSHIYYGLQPMELWDSLGITSYDLGNPSAHLAQTYWTIKLALRHDKPDLIVLDTYEMYTNKKRINAPFKMHINFDAVPVSLMKFRAMEDLNNGDLKKTIKYTLPLAEYYNNWPSREARKEGNEQLKEFRITKGSRLLDDITDMSDVTLPEPDDLPDKELVSVQYFKKIIKECREQQVDLLVISIPFYGPAGKQKGTNTVQNIVDEYDVPYIDMRYTGLVDPEYDCISDNHLNFSGTQKVTSYLADYLEDNYDLSPHKDDAVAKAWDKDYVAYHSLIIEKLREADTLHKYLLWLKGNHFSSFIYMPESAHNKLTDKMIDNIDSKIMISEDKAIKMLGMDPAKEVAIITEDARTGDIVDKCVFIDGKAEHLTSP